MNTATRGVRNNNPGNIDYNPRNDWVGQLPPDPTIEKRFARFDSPENGIRALGKLLLAYRPKTGMPDVGGSGIDTVREVITRWAPGVENDTNAYVQAVSKGLGVRADQALKIDDPATLKGLVMGIIKHENGGVPYADNVITEGVRRALA